MTFDRDNAIQMFETTVKDIYALLKAGKIKGALSKCEIVIDALETIQDGIKGTAEKV